MPTSSFLSTSCCLLKRFCILALFLFCFFDSDLYAQWPKLSPEALQRQAQLIENMQKNPNDALARFDLAMQLAYTGWIEHAWYQLKKIPDLDPEFKTDHEDRLFDAIQAHPENAFLHFKIAFAYYFNDKKDLSLAAFMKAQRLAPENAWIMGFIALIYGDKKNYSEAIRWCKRALKLEPKATALHFLLAEGYRQTGQYLLLVGESMQVLNAKNGEKGHAPPLPK